MKPSEKKRYAETIIGALEVKREGLGGRWSEAQVNVLELNHAQARTLLNKLLFIHNIYQEKDKKNQIRQI